LEAPNSSEKSKPKMAGGERETERAREREREIEEKRLTDLIIRSTEFK
jgi:hypothetical protein